MVPFSFPWSLLKSRVMKEHASSLFVTHKVRNQALAPFPTFLFSLLPFPFRWPVPALRFRIPAVIAFVAISIHSWLKMGPASCWIKVDQASDSSQIRVNQDGSSQIKVDQGYFFYQPYASSFLSVNSKQAHLKVVMIRKRTQNHSSLSLCSGLLGIRRCGESPRESVPPVGALKIPL